VTTIEAEVPPEINVAVEKENDSILFRRDTV
jgi:hypothetical protein